MTELNAVFGARRQRLLDAMPNNSVALVLTGPEQVRSNDCDYHFRPNSDFYYLTGFEEPEAALLLKKAEDEATVTLFCRPKDTLREIWDGRRVGPDAAKERFAVDYAFEIAELDQRMGEALCDTDVVLLSQLRQAEIAPMFECWMAVVRAQRKQGVRAPESRLDLDAVLAEQRLIKDAHEIALMRTAAKISADAHSRAMAVTKPGIWEYQVEAEIKHEFAMNGARHEAYNSIVGSGENACILHYVENNCQTKDGDLLLIDAGCEYQMYAADITRTFPVNGKFSDAQRAVYEVVLKAQEAAIDVIAPGVSYDRIHDTAVRILTEGMVELGWLTGDVDELIKTEAFKKYYMHGTGHWLGIDVHDVGDYRVAGEKTWRALEAGMVLTVEPALYVAIDDESVDAKWRGIGVRIEDDILVTDSGYENLTSDVPKSIEAVEALVGSRA